MKQQNFKTVPCKLNNANMTKNTFDNIMDIVSKRKRKKQPTKILEYIC